MPRPTLDSKLRRLLALCLGLLPALLMLIFLPSLALKPATGEAKVWRVTHDTSDWGKLNLWIGDAGVRVELNRLQCVMVAAPPSWNPVLFNTARKTRWDTTLAKLNKTQLYPAVVDYSYRDDWSKATKAYGKMRGVDAVCLSLNTNIKFAPMMSSLSIEEKTLVVKQMRYFHTRSLKVPEPALQVVTTMYHLPRALGIPLALGYTDETGRRAWGIVLVQIKQEAVSPSLFTCPPGFKKIANHLEVLGHENFKDIDDMARDLGLGEEFGKTKGKR